MYIFLEISGNFLWDQVSSLHWRTNVARLRCYKSPYWCVCKWSHWGGHCWQVVFFSLWQKCWIYGSPVILKWICGWKYWYPSTFLLKLAEVYGIHHSLFHIEHNWNFAFDLQLNMLFNTIKEMKMAGPKILVPLT